MQSLLDWTADPSPSAPSPLPSLATVRRGAFPVALLPWHMITRDLERLYAVRYERRKGFSGGLFGAPDDFTVARWTSGILHDAAANLWTREAPSALWQRQAEQQAAEVDRLQARAHAERPDDYEAAEELSDAYSIGLDPRAVATRARADSAELLAVDRQAAALGDRFKDHAEALNRTAHAVKAYPTVQKVALQRLRAELLPPADDADASPDAAPASSAFLEEAAARSGGDPIRRSTLARDYVAAGSPGALSKPDLFALAADLWGAPRPTKGHYVYRPSTH